MRKLFTTKLLLLLFITVPSIITQAQTNPSPQALPYNQNFSTFTGSTTVYPAGIQGWGFGSTALSTTFNIAAPTADQALAGTTNASTSGFVGDMNGKIGVLATGTNIKAICLAINTTSLTNISVSFLAATQRQVVTERINELGVQYRIGTSGTFTNIVASTYQNNLAVANTSGTASVNPVTVSFTLPAACVNQAIVQLRWIQRDVSGAGGRPSFSVDDIAITGAPLLSSNADLSNLTLSTGVLLPAFVPATTSYTASVANAVTSITVTPTSSDINSTITVNGNAVASGSPSASIPLIVGANTVTTIVTAQDAVTIKTYTVTVTRAAAGVPTLSITTALPGFGAVCINTTTGSNSFIIDGSNLDGSAINIAALSGFSYAETAGGTYTATLSFSYTAPGFISKEIFVKFNPLLVQSYNGDISLSGGGLAAAFLVPAIGSGVNTPLTVTTGTSSAVTATTATAAGTITVAGCSPVTAYGIEYSTATGFPNGTGTQVASFNLSAGNFSSNITGLAPNTRYYYKAYATNGGGTTYGTEQFFTNLPLPVPMALQPNLTFTETFADIANWNNFFAAGAGANHWDGLSTNGTTPIPSAAILTASTNSFQTPITPGTNVTAGGVQKGTDQIPGTQSIVLLSTGSPDNTTSAAIDFYMDFTGLNAGTLSFDYETLNNSTGNRNGSLRVYATADGTAFTELPFANVLDFTNNISVSGSKSNIALPAIFNQSATARLRFYYHNGSGNTGSGSRPKISIDNVKITAVATTPCATPTAPATALIFGTITDVSIAAGFTAASPATDGYIVVMSANNSLTGNPVNGQIYNIGDNLGDGTVIANGNATTFTATGLTALTTYYFFIFPVNSICTGGPLYFTASILNGSATTIAGLPPCAAPALQPTALQLNPPAPTINTIQGSFTATTANEYLVLRSTSNTLTNTPASAQVYNAGDVLGNAVVVQRSAATTFTASGLLPATQYYFFVFSLNSQGCVNGPVYNTVSPLTGTETTQPLPPCVAPSAQPASLTLTAANTAVSGTFTGVPSADDYLVIRSLSPTLSVLPADNTDYNVGDNLGGGIVVANSATTSFLAASLTANTTYYFYVFAANKNCSGGTKYLTASPLTGNIVTTNTGSNNYYFGTLHSHSDYSDGNKDNQGYTPADDYNYALSALCMDYLGISEHNHFSSPDNPGDSLINYHLGIAQATTFNNTHPNFLALYGMEWGVISGGGHVLIYGDGMDNLWGWESGTGGWGTTNNYDVYVAKSDYTGNAGLFKTVNDNSATNTFASLAHPNLSDFNNIAGTAYNLVADNAITAVAVESGPSSSTNTSYSNPGSSLSYLWYYQTLLAKGYHLGPTVDHDNHYTTFGKTTTSRTAIVSPNLTKTAIVNALRNMNFYATQDCDSKVDFTINTKIMGSILNDRFAPNISVTLTDATTSTATAVIRVMFGLPGSAILAVKIDSVIGSTLSFTDNSLANLATGYYYIDITNGTSRIVTAPIWYTRNDAAVLPIKLSSFTVQKINNTAKISWVTEQEINSSHFIVERSVDGRIWNTIATVTAAGNSSHLINYSIVDNAPMRGINYYRLKQVDKDAKYDYSVIQKALFNSIYTAQIVPNPAKDFINLYMAKAGNKPATIQVLNTNGKLVYKTTTAQLYLQINTAAFSKGLYFVKVIDADNVTTIKVEVQ